MLPQIAGRRAIYACRCGATVTLEPSEPLPEGWATTTVASWGEHINWRAKAYRPSYLCPACASPLEVHAVTLEAGPANLCRECLAVEVPQFRRFCSPRCERERERKERAAARAAQRGRRR